MLLFAALLTEAAKLVNFELQFKSLKILADILRGKKLLWSRKAYAFSIDE